MRKEFLEKIAKQVISDIDIGFKFKSEINLSNMYMSFLEESEARVKDFSDFGSRREVSEQFISYIYDEGLINSFLIWMINTELYNQCKNEEEYKKKTSKIIENWNYLYKKSNKKIVNNEGEFSLETINFNTSEEKNKKPKNNESNKFKKDNVNKQEFQKLTKELEKKNKDLIELRNSFDSKIKSFEENFLNKIKEKTKQAQVLVDEKKAELEAKFAEELETKKEKIYTSEIIDLIETIEQFEAIINSPVDNDILKNYLMGFRMISDMFNKNLEQMKITKKIIKVGDKFDPSFMQAFETNEIDGFEKDQVTFVIKNAYFYKDKNIKPGVVKVNK